MPPKRPPVACHRPRPPACPTVLFGGAGPRSPGKPGKPAVEVPKMPKHPNIGAYPITFYTSFWVHSEAIAGEYVRALLYVSSLLGTSSVPCALTLQQRLPSKAPASSAAVTCKPNAMGIMPGPQSKCISCDYCSTGWGSYPNTCGPLETSAFGGPMSCYMPTREEEKGSVLYTAALLISCEGSEHDVRMCRFFLSF